MEILNINWSNAFMVSILGVGIVFVVLIMLVFLLNGFSCLFVEKKNRTTHIQEVTVDGVPTEAEAAAIAMALHLYFEDVHDEESDIITIVDNKNSVWNSKILSLQ